MEDNDNTKSSGRGFKKARGRGRGKGNNILSHSSFFEAPADTQPPYSTMKPTHHHISQKPTNIQTPQSTMKPTNTQPPLYIRQPTHHPISQTPTNIQTPQSTMKPTNTQPPLYTRQPTHHPISQTPTNIQTPQSTMKPTNTQPPHSTRQLTHHLISKNATNIQPPYSTRQPINIQPLNSTRQPTNIQHLHSTPIPQISTTHAPTSQTPTNIQSPHSTPSPHISTTHSLPHSPSGVASDDDPHASSSCDGSYPTTGSQDPTDRRIWIRPGPQLTFDPAVQPTRDVTKIIKRLFQGTWECYGEIKKKDTNLADMWYKEFQRTYKWLPEHERDIRKVFDHKASDSYTNAMYRVRKGIDRGNWIHIQLRETLEQNCKNSGWNKKAEINKQNRRSSDGPLHTGGSIPTTEHAKRLKTDSGMTPNCWDLFQKTHKLKGNPSKWVSSKSEMVANEYERRIYERNSQQTEGDDVFSHHQSDNMVFLDVVGGVDKKGRIYGLGPEAGKYKPSSSRSSDGISTSEYEHMRAEISNMSAENIALKEQLKTHEDLIRASQEESRLVREQSQEESWVLREQLQELMKYLSQGHSQYLPTHSNPPDS